MDWTTVLLIIVLGVLLVSAAEFLFGIFPRRYFSQVTPATYGWEFDDITLQTADMLTLAGWWIPAANNTDRTIIVGHGYGYDKGEILQEVTFLHDNFNLLLFDFRYFGESQGHMTTLGFKETLDFSAAVDYMEQHHPNHSIGAYGFSLGASVFLRAADPRINALVADSPFARLDLQLESEFSFLVGPLKKPFVWTTSLLARIFLGFWTSEVSPYNAIKDIHCPLLIIHGKSDTKVPFDHSQKLFSQADKQTTDLWLVEGAEHVMAQELISEEYQKRVRHFFGNTL